MGAGKVARQVFVGYVAGKDNVLPIVLLDKFLKTTSQATFANEEEACLWKLLTNIRNGTQ